MLARVHYVLPVYVYVSEDHDDSETEHGEHHDERAEPRAVEPIEVATPPSPPPAM